jgi:surface polysaccharide O-acyltransferase-like enzyme
MTNKIKTINKERNINADLIRSLAIFFVIGVHFWLNSGLYSEIIIGKRMLIALFFRSVFITCVPLFMLLTGYLMNNHLLSKKYYKGIMKIITIYLTASIICLLFTKYYLYIPISIKNSILSVLSFSAAPYSWYIEMYLGFFLLIPFINKIWINLKDMKEKKYLYFHC